MRRRRWLRGALAAGALVAAALAGGAAAPAAGEEHGVLVERQVYLMGTLASMAVRAPDRGRGLDALETLLSSLEATAAELSTWRPDSLLSELNRQPVGRPYDAPEPLCALLLRLRHWRRETGGAFDPAIGSLVAAWGLRDGGRRPTPDELAGARASAGLEHLVIEASPCRITRRRPVTLDAGGFGKGAAIERAAATAAARPLPSWMIDLGGQITAGGDDDRGWDVAVAHPLQRERPLLRLRLVSGSLATSGGSVRDLRVAGERIGHILDPRTGRAVSRDGSVTVWHADALVADILSTALYVMGAEDGLDWAARHGVAALFLSAEPGGDGIAVRPTPAFRERFPEALSQPASP